MQLLWPSPIKILELKEKQKQCWTHKFMERLKGKNLLTTESKVFLSNTPEMKTQKPHEVAIHNQNNICRIILENYKVLWEELYFKWDSELSNFKKRSTESRF